MERQIDREMGEKREMGETETETQVQRVERQRLRDRRGNETVSDGKEKPPVSRERKSVQRGPGMERAGASSGETEAENATERV